MLSLFQFASFAGAQMDLLLIAVIGVVGGYYFPWWVLLVGLAVLAVLYRKFKKSDTDSETVYFLCGLALFAGLCVGNLIYFLMHHHISFMFS